MNSVFGDVLQQHTKTARILDPAGETFVTLRLSGKGAVKRKIGDGKTPQPFSGYRVQAGQFIYSRIDARNGAFAIVPPELDGAVVSKDFPVFHINTTIVDPDFLLAVVSTESFSDGIKRLSFGATNRQRVKEEIFLRLPLRLPPLDEQRRIATILAKADELRTKRRQALAHLDTLTQSIFHSMFPGDGTEDAELGPLLTFVTSGGRGWAKYYSDSDVGSKFVRSLDVRRNFIDTESPVFVHAPDNAEAKRTQVRADDVLLTITGSLIGRAAPVLPPLAGSYVSQHVAILRPDTVSILPTYLSHFLNLERGGQRIIQHMQYGQTKPGLNFEQIRKFKIPLPVLGRQQAFATRVAAVERLKESHRKHLAELDALFASLQHRAFKGEL